MKSIYLSIIFFIYATGATSCQQDRPKVKEIKASTAMKKFEWRPTESAPKSYPIEIVQGVLTNSDTDIETKIPRGSTIHGGWGELGSLWITGEKLKPVPDKLEITWLSFAEKKFYSGSFDLPMDKMTSLFENGHIDYRGVQEDFNKIIIGLAPKGVIAVWLSGPGASVEIGFFKGKEVQLSMEDFHPGGVPTLKEYLELNTQELPEEIKSNFDNPITPEVANQWESYRTRFPWKPLFEPSEKGNLVRVLVKYYNGEKVYVKADDTAIQEFQYRPIPKQINLHWTDKNKFKYAGDFSFDASVVFKAFESLYKEVEPMETDFVIQIDKYNSNASFYLRTKSNQVKLESSESKIFPIDG